MKKLLLILANTTLFVSFNAFATDAASTQSDQHDNSAAQSNDVASHPASVSAKVDKDSTSHDIT